MTDNFVVALATQEDCEVLYRWYCAAVEEKTFKINDIPTYANHCRWFEDVLTDDLRFIYVGQIDGQRFGTTRFDYQASGVWEMSISVDRSFRGLGLAPRIIRGSIGAFSETHDVRMVIASGWNWNLASRKSFLRAGFVERALPDADWRAVQRFVKGEEFYVEYEPPSERKKA